MEPEVLELDTLVFTEAEALRPAFQARGLYLTLEFPEAPSLVRANPAALRATLNALLENALQHTAKGGRVRVWVEGPRVGVYNEPPHPQSGTGLGLRLAETLVRAQGGRLEWGRGEGFQAVLWLRGA